jgi:hemerythrin-like domain-containing protein
METNIMDAMGDRHDEIREQLAHMESWVEGMPTTNAEDRRVGMQRIVDFLQHYVLVDAHQEERDLFPSVGARAEVLRAEHRFIERWAHELAQIARDATDASDGVRFRATAFKLFGLLEAHMHCEEVVLGRATSSATPPPQTLVEVG